MMGWEGEEEGGRRWPRGGTEGGAKKRRVLKPVPSTDLGFRVKGRDLAAGESQQASADINNIQTYGAARARVEMRLCATSH